MMVSRIRWKCLGLGQLTRKRFVGEIEAQPSYGLDRARKIVSDADQASASTRFFDETMVTVK